MKYSIHLSSVILKRFVVLKRTNMLVRLPIALGVMASILQPAGYLLAIALVTCLVASGIGAIRTIHNIGEYTYDPSTIPVADLIIGGLPNAACALAAFVLAGVLIGDRHMAPLLLMPWMMLSILNIFLVCMFFAKYGSTLRISSVDWENVKNNVERETINARSVTYSQGRR